MSYAIPTGHSHSISPLLSLSISPLLSLSISPLPSLSVPTATGGAASSASVSASSGSGGLGLSDRRERRCSRSPASNKRSRRPRHAVDLTILGYDDFVDLGIDLSMPWALIWASICLVNPISTDSIHRH